MARIQTADDLGVGTGFLVAGPDLHPDLPPLVVVTNGHVVPEDLDPGHAHVAFHGLDDDQGRQGRFRVVRQWWYQPSADRGLDTTILELDGYPQDVVPTPLAKGLPPPLSHRRAYVIGHPGGSAQPQFSFRTTSCSTTTTASCTIAHRPRAAAPAARFPTTNGD